MNEPQDLPASDDTGQGVTTPHVSAQERTRPDLREPLGRLVHDIRLACEAERAAAEGRRRFNLPAWEDRDDWQRELDMRIGHAVANYALTENALTYGISCPSCAAKLDRANEERERAERAEVKLAALRTVLLEGGQDNATVRRRALAIIVSEEGRDA